MNASFSHREKVVVVGAGMAGLSCAISLATRGVEVEVLEKSSAPGGKMRLVSAGDTHMDGGPTVFTMRWVFDELLGEAGISLEDAVGLSRADVLARHAWPGAAMLDLFADRAKTADAIGMFGGSAEARGYLRFCHDAAQVHDALKDSFMFASRPNPLQLVARIARQNPLGLARLRSFSTLWSALGGYFSDQRLRQLFARYSTYVGSSPFAAPSTLMLIAHVEQEGVFLVSGGMHALAKALEKTARRLGVVFRYGFHASGISHDNSGFSVVGEGCETSRGGKLVFCGDVSDLPRLVAGQNTGQKPLPVKHRSLSAMVFAMQARTRSLTPARHTVMFSNDYKAEFDAIFRHGRSPENPTVYLCAHDRDDTGALADHDAPERVYLLINAPANGDFEPYPQSGTDECLQRTLRQMKACGLELEPVGPVNTTSPADWNRMFPGSGGAIYGRASHGWMASFARPGTRTAMPGLYLASGTVHPGAGVPMAALSGRLAAQSILSDLALTRR